MDVPGQPFAILWMQQDPINSVHWWDVKYNRGYVDPTTQPMYVVQEDSNQPLWVKPPTADYQFIPNQAQLSAETHATADQLPGGTNNHEWMGYLQITTERSGSLHIGSTDYFVNTWQEGGWYGQQTFGDNTMQMWDYACAN
jgi:hypothetical protein